MPGFHDYDLDEIHARNFVVRDRVSARQIPQPEQAYYGTTAPETQPQYQAAPPPGGDWTPQVVGEGPDNTAAITKKVDGNRNMKFLAIGAAAVVAIALWKTSTSAETSPESANVHAAAKTHHHNKQATKPGGTSTTAPGSVSSESANPSDEASPSATASQSPAALIPAPANVQLSAPACIDYKVVFMNDKTDKKKQTVFPTSWDFLSADSGPYVAAGKMSGPMALQACIDTSAIKYDKAASQRTGNSVISMDVSKATITPLSDQPDLHNGISYAKAISTDKKLLAALKKNNPDATPADVANLHALWDANVGKIQSLNLLTSFDWLKYYYQKPLVDDEFATFKESLQKQLEDKGYTAQIVPDVSAPQTVTFNINQVPEEKLEGPFHYLAAPATINAGILNTDSGKQLVPETQP